MNFIKIKSTSNTFKFHLNDEKNIDFVKISDKRFNLIKNNKVYKIILISYDQSRNNIILEVNNELIEYKIENEQQLQIKKMIFKSGIAKFDNKFISPMPGLVSKINVKEKQKVKQGDSLIILEAMKTENILKATANGIIKQIKIKEGDVVEKNTILILFE